MEAWLLRSEGAASREREEAELTPRKEQPGQLLEGKGEFTFTNRQKETDRR